MDSIELKPFNLKVIEKWKLKGYSYVKLNVLNTGSQYVATIELMPIKQYLDSGDFQINSRELVDFATANSPMVNYVFNSAQEN